MHNLAPEPFAAREIRCESLLVAVVAGTHEDEAAADCHGLSRIIVFGIDLPGRVAARPSSFTYPVAVSNVTIDIPFRRRLFYVFKDRWAVSDGLAVTPRFEFVTERVHVAVRAYARKAEQIPGSAHVIAAFEDDVSLARTLFLQVMR